MRVWAREMKQTALMKWSGVYNFQSKISLSIDSGSYELKTAETHEELISSFRLRHQVFYQEFQNVEKEGIDFDKYDSHFDHLIIVQKLTQKVIGTYRINCSSFSSLTYTESEFNLSEVFNLEGPHLELGRACIHKDHRKGVVLSLLWRGITDYMSLSGANILFGCSSIKVSNVNEAAMLYKHLSDLGAVMDTPISFPTRNFRMPDFDIYHNFYQDGLTEEQKQYAEKLLPPLLKSYIKFGAKIASLPAYDKEFNCVDLLTILKKEDMKSSLIRRFQLIQ